MKRVYVVGYYQSPFGKLLDTSIPKMVTDAVDGVCREVGVPARARSN